MEKGYDWSNKTTYVQFHELYEIEQEGLLQAHFRGNIENKSKLRENTVNAIVNCIKKSEDVSRYHLTLLR